MSSSRASLPNFYLRKTRKWPIPPYKTKWNQDFACQQAMEMLKEKATKHSKTNLLQSLIDSFATHNCSPFPEAYHFILKRLFRNPRIWDQNQIPQIVYHMQKVADFETPEVDVAVQLFNYMVVRKTLDFDGRIATLILRAMCEQNESDIMLFLRDTRNFGGFRIDKADWCNVICCLVKLGSGKDAMKALSWMRQDGVEADIVCYNLVLDKLVLEEEYACADQLFDEMVVLGLVPDIFTYNSYIECLCKQNKGEDGVKMLYCMEEMGCKPNLKTYEIILKALLTGGKWDLAKEITRKMECITERP